MINIIKKHHRKILLTAPILFLMISADYIPKENGVFLKPSTYFPELGTPFYIDVNYFSNVLFNATDGIINYPSNNIETNEITLDNTNISLWGSTPEWSNSNGVISWSGGIIAPSLRNGKQEGHIIKVKMTPLKSLPIDITIKEASLLAANGSANNIIEVVGGIKIFPRPKNTPSPDIDNDGKLTPRDMAQVMIGIGKKYNPKIDINGDKSINYKDVNNIIMYYNELNKSN